MCGSAKIALMPAAKAFMAGPLAADRYSIADAGDAIEPHLACRQAGSAADRFDRAADQTVSRRRGSATHVARIPMDGGSLGPCLRADLRQIIDAGQLDRTLFTI